MPGEARVSDAAAEGDRSWIAEYLYGKKRLPEIHWRARFLKNRQEILMVVQETPPNIGKVYFTSWVKVEDAGGNEAAIALRGPMRRTLNVGLSRSSPPWAVR